MTSTSTSGTIEEVLAKYVPDYNDSLAKTKALCFLDRDGVINRDIGYLHDPSKFELTEGVLEGLKKISEAG